jgi:large subunit ribosomal protein L4
MLKVNSYSTKGTKLTSITLPKAWEEKSNDALLAQAIRVYNDRAHFGLVKAQTRSEVNRTTKKWYKQKGTGGARHGARSAPQFVGGGVALGPRPVSRELTLPDKMKIKALHIAISLAVKEGRITVADMSFKKTNEVQKFIDKVMGKEVPRVTFVIKKENLKSGMFVKNIKNAAVVNFSDLNVFEVFFGGNIVFDKSIFAKEREKLSEPKKSLPPRIKKETKK